FYEMINTQLPNLRNLTLYVKHKFMHLPDMNIPIDMPILRQLEKCVLCLHHPFLSTILPSIRQYAQHNHQLNSFAIGFEGRDLTDLADIDRNFCNKVTHFHGFGGFNANNAILERISTRFTNLRVLRLSAAEETVRFDERSTRRDRKSTRLNSSHVSISYGVFSLESKHNRRNHIQA